MRPYQYAILLVLSIVAGRAQAADAYATPWYSTLHFGYAVETQSSTGFEKTGGSTVLLDFGRRFGDVGVGLRTMAAGAEGANSQTFYRLHTGPAVSYSFDQDWAVDGSVNFFRQSVLGDGGQKSYLSSGYGAMLGWERLHRLGDRTILSWGGFVTAYSGDISWVGATLPVAGSIPTRNAGSSRGFKIALRTTL